MKKIIPFLLLISLGCSVLNAQTLTIINQTDCQLRYYSGAVIVDTTNHPFGSETDIGAFIMPNSNDSYLLEDINSYEGPLSYQTLSFIGFKFRMYDSGNNSGYVGSDMPYYLSTSPEPTCNNGGSITAVWTGAADNPVVFILP